MDSTDEDGGLMNEQLLVLSGEGGCYRTGCARGVGVRSLLKCVFNEVIGSADDVRKASLQRQI